MFGKSTKKIKNKEKHSDSMNHFYFIGNRHAQHNRVQKNSNSGVGEQQRKIGSRFHTNLDHARDPVWIYITHIYFHLHH